MNKKHNFIYKAIRPLVILFTKIRFGYTYDKAAELPENYIVLSNHTTDYDMLMVAASFPRQMYFVGSEHIARWGFLSKVIKFAFAPIMRYKGTVAANTVIDIMRKTKKGDNVCIFAEGVRSWDGTSSPILPSTAKLIKRAGCGLVTYRITGGYFASPMWGGASVRRGYVHGSPVRVFTKEQIKEMSVAEIYAVITEDLWEDAYARQIASPKPYRSKKAAEHLENLFYICPVCGERDTFSSQGDRVRCNACELSMRYDEYGILHDGPYSTVRDFAEWQKKQLRSDVESGLTYTAQNGVLSRVDDHDETEISKGTVFMDRETLRCGDFSVPMADISDLAMHGQRAVVFSAYNDYYEIITDRGCNALKFFLYYKDFQLVTGEPVEA